MVIFNKIELKKYLIEMNNQLTKHHLNVSNAWTMTHCARTTFQLCVLEIIFLSIQ